MKKCVVIGSATVLVAASAALAGWRMGFWREETPAIVLYGNVDLRQVQLPFNAQQRVSKVHVEEGDRVRAGELVAELETVRLEAAVADADARAQSQQRVVERLVNGTRDEEIDQARAELESANADLAKAFRNHLRYQKLAQTDSASQQEIDDARSEYDSAVARQHVKQRALDLANAGPRAEEVGEAKATLAALEAQLQLRQHELADAQLHSPVNGVVRNRILEPGEMCSPGSPALTIAVTDPKWVRAYVNEADLAQVKPGTGASITVDAYPGTEFAGWVGFVSPVAEFTPKTVETPELRTSLVYEVRVMFRDNDDLLRLGMPASVTVHPDKPIVALVK